MASSVRAAALSGLEVTFVDVETDLSLGLPNFLVVGLPDMAVQEARERVRSSIKHSGVELPRHRITVNLAPADVRKEGPGFDLPIALSVLVASGQLPALARDTVAVGELSLDGTLRRVSGVLPIAVAAKRQGLTTLVVPHANVQEAKLVKGLTVLGAENLLELLDHLMGKKKLQNARSKRVPKSTKSSSVQLSDVLGQEQAKRALEIAAAGGHNLLLSGPPGSGKTMLAKAFAGLLPPLTFQDALEVTQLYSVAGLLRSNEALLDDRPFRSPHHTASTASIIGGGRQPRPGEISLAHKGVLFLDEFPEFPRAVIEALREPLEEGTVVVSRVAGSIRFPADFTLIAAMNPCPCGYLTDDERACTCSPRQVLLYHKRLSGPILDRIDLHVHVPRLLFSEVTAPQQKSSVDVVLARISAARQQQETRYGNSLLNRHLTVPKLKKFVVPDSDGLDLLKQAMSTMQLSLRAYHRVLKVARTIADLAGEEKVSALHIAEALQYRPRHEAGTVLQR